MLKRLLRYLSSCKDEAEQPEGLIGLLLDKSAETGDRHDAAMDLGIYDDPRVERALLQVALDLTEDEEIADAVGESLSQVWKRAGKEDVTIVEQMHPAARKFFKPSV